MRAVVQRVTQASVTVAGKIIGQIDRGFMVLVAAGPRDTAADITYLTQKISKLRVFSDADGKMNLALADVDGAVLSVSQFTLYADTKKGNRPSFTQAATPEVAEHWYEAFNQQLRDLGLTVETGEFGADMAVSLTNDGPVTIMYDSEMK